jgi:hypothetical protein
VILDKDKMAENGIDPMGISQMIQANNSSSPSAFCKSGWEYLITTGKFLTSADDVENLVVGLNKKGLFIWDKLPPFRMDLQQPKVMSFGYGKPNDNYKVRNLNIPVLPYPLEKSKRMQWKFRRKFLKSRTFKDKLFERCSCQNQGNGCG